jgi:hypothetical protein
VGGADFDPFIDPDHEKDWRSLIMSFESISPFVLFLFGLTSLVNLVSRDWRVVLSALGIQYVGVFILVAQIWPLEMAVIKLVAGLIAAAVMGMELIKIPFDRALPPEIQEDKPLLSSILFRVFLAILAGLAVYSVAPDMAKWVLNASYQQILGSLLLAAMGILIMGITSQPFRVIVGLLTFLSGFEILFATLETSALVAGFLAFMSLGIALLGTYFIAVSELNQVDG